MTDSSDPPELGGLAAAWIAAVNIDLSASMAVSRAAARALAELSPDARHALKKRLAEEAASLEARGSLESGAAAAMVRRAVDGAG